MSKPALAFCVLAIAVGPVGAGSITISSGSTYSDPSFRGSDNIVGFFTTPGTSTYLYTPPSPLPPVALALRLVVKQGGVDGCSLYATDPSKGVPKVGIASYNALSAPTFGTLASGYFSLDTKAWTERLAEPATTKVTYTATNFSGLTSQPADLTVTVIPNTRPVLDCEIEPVLNLFSTAEKTCVLAGYDGRAKTMVMLGGSTDADREVLTYNVYAWGYTASASPHSWRVGAFDVWIREDCQELSLVVTDQAVTMDGQQALGVSTRRNIGVEVVTPQDAIDRLAATYGVSMQSGQLRSTFLAQLRILSKHLKADAKPKRLAKSLRTQALNNLLFLRKLAARAPGSSPEVRAQMIDVVDQLGALLNP